jgi:hypothetical protein
MDRSITFIKLGNAFVLHCRYMEGELYYTQTMTRIRIHICRACDKLQYPTPQKTSFTREVNETLGKKKVMNQGVSTCDVISSFRTTSCTITVRLPGRRGGGGGYCACCCCFCRLCCCRCCCCSRWQCSESCGPGQWTIIAFSASGRLRPAPTIPSSESGNVRILHVYGSLAFTGGGGKKRRGDPYWRRGTYGCPLPSGSSSDGIGQSGGLWFIPQGPTIRFPF